jgi:hypothetical protein
VLVLGLAKRARPNLQFIRYGSDCGRGLPLLALACIEAARLGFGV